MATEPQILSSLSPMYAHLLFCRILPPLSTLVEKPLQINLFMQNKPNLVRRRRIANERKYLITNGL